MTILRHVWALMQGHRARYLAAIAALVVASCFLYLAPLVPQVVIDGVLLPSDARSSEDAGVVGWGLRLMGGREVVADNLWIPAAVMVVISGIAGVFTYLRGRWSAAATEAIVQRLRDRVYDHLQHLPTAYFDQAETGDIIQRCTSDVETVRGFLGNQVVEIGRAIIMLFVPIPLMLAIDARMTVAALVMIPIITGFSGIFFRRIRHRFREADEAEGRMTTTISENLSGIRVVRAFARQAHEQARFSEKNVDYRDHDLGLYRVIAVFWAVSDLLCFVQQGVVIVAGLVWLIAGSLTVGTFFYFLTAVAMFTFPMRMLGRIVADLGKATVAVERLQEILDEPAEGNPTDPEDLADGRGEIVFDHVTFTYPGSKTPALDDLSLRIAPQETVAIIGPSGAGKSTLVSLLLRLYDPETGTIALDGHDLRQLDRGDLRRSLAVALQEPFLYSKTLAANLRLGRPDAGRDHLTEAARVANVHDAIEAFDDGYETKVGERGVTLSGGQRQRVALARALLRRPSVLVLDDALSAVDTRTEAGILAALEQRRGRHTTIIIAHRLSTVRLADRIVVLQGGRVRDVGTHDELVRREGLYARLWRLQSGSSTAPAPTVAGTRSSDHVHVRP